MAIEKLTASAILFVEVVPLGYQLQREGAESFDDSWNKLRAALRRRAETQALDVAD